MRILGTQRGTAPAPTDAVSAPPSARPVVAPPVRSGWVEGLRTAAVATAALLLGVASGSPAMPQAAEAAVAGAHRAEHTVGVPVTALADTVDLAPFEALLDGTADPEPPSPSLTDMVYSLLADDGGLDPEAWRDFRDATVAAPPSADDVRRIRVSLYANNGTLFRAEDRARVIAFLEHPSPELRAAAHAAGEVLDAGAARAQIALAAGLPSSAQARGALSATLRAFDLCPEAQDILTEALGRYDRRALVAEALAAPIDNARWEAEVVPNLVDLPHTWSETADEVLRARFADPEALPDDVRRSMATFLRSRGYPVNRPSAQTFEAVRAGNVTTPDTHFEDLMARAGRDGRLVVGIADGGFDLASAPARAKNQPNADEIPNNDVDEDGDGYVDNYHGVNLLGLVDEEPLFGEPARGRLRTGLGRLDYHGNHVTGVATRGTDRLSAAMVATSSGQLAEAFDYLAKEGAKVINFSMGVTPTSVEATLAAIDRHPDILFVHAAGNDSADVTDAAPEMSGINRVARPNLVDVAAVGEDGARLPTSNYSRAHVELAAPAKHFSFSLTDMTSNQRFEEGLYHYAGQTSQASPNAANALAKVRLLAPKLSPAEAIRLVEVTSTPDARWTNLVRAGGVVDPAPAQTAAALLGLLQDGLTVEGAAAQLALPAGAVAVAQDSLRQAQLLD